MRNRTNKANKTGRKMMLARARADEVGRVREMFRMRKPGAALADSLTPGYHMPSFQDFQLVLRREIGGAPGG